MTATPRFPGASESPGTAETLEIPASVGTPGVASGNVTEPALDGAGHRDDQLTNDGGLARPQSGLPASAPDRAATHGCDRHLTELLAPFVAWLATQGINEPGRRRHRDAVERFLRWSHADDGPVESRRRRYEHHLGEHDPAHLAAAHAGLAWWTDHRRILALTHMVGP